MSKGKRGDTHILFLLIKKFLWSKQSDGFLSLITWVSILGVVLGVVALTVVTSVINGFEAELTRVVTSFNGEVFLYSRGNPISHSEEIEQKIKQTLPQLKSITTSFITELMVAGPHGVAGGVLEGINLETIGNVTDLPKRVVSGRMPQYGNEIVLAVHLAERIGAKEGDIVKLVLPFAGEAQESKVFEATVVGQVKVGMYRYDSKFIFAPLSYVQSITGHPDQVTNFRMNLAPRSDLTKATQALTENFGYPFRAKYWGQLDQNLFMAIELEKAVLAVILTAILVVAAFNVVSTLMMMIYDKTQEIAILKAMGLEPRAVFKMFCGIGVMIGTIGTMIGVGVGIGINRLIERWDFVKLPEDIYHIGKWKVIERWQEIVIIVLFAILISFISTLYPAWTIMRKSPLEGLRYE